MKDIKESFNSIQDITPYLKGETRIDEGLKEIFNTIKSKFKHAFIYLKSVVVKLGTYFLGTDDNGNVLPAITPLTSGSAYKDGLIDKRSTFVKMDKEGAKITGCKTKFDDALKLYGKLDAISYWAEQLNESADSEYETICESEKSINEVKLHTDDPEALYNIIVDDAELKDEIKLSLDDHNQARLMIWGAPGIGKTAILMNVLEEMKADYPDYRLIMKTLSNETPDNFTLPKYVEIDGQDFATDVPKTWLPVYKPTGNPAEDKILSDKCGHGLLFIDELSRATPQVLNVVLPLVNEGVFNGYKLGDGWTIICASNRPEDEMSGQSSIGNALSNRFVQLFYEPTVHTWRKWADKQNFISPLLLQWLSMPEGETMSGGKFYYMDPNEDSSRINDTTIWCSPRSWTNAMRRLARRHHTGKLEGFSIFDIPTNIIARTLNGCVPKQAVDGFLAFLKVIQEIGNFDEAVYNVWKTGKISIDKKKLNLISLPLAQLVCTAHAKELPTAKEFENFANCVVSLNSDQFASYALDVFCNVFMGEIENPDYRGQVFLMQERIRRNGGDVSKLKGFNAILKPFCDKWNISLEDIPDYYKGLSIITKKYGESFMSAKVGDHTNALG